MMERDSRQDERFREDESVYTMNRLLKYDYLDKQILRENIHYSKIPIPEPVKVGDYIYYRRADNAADNMTLYNFPCSELQKFGIHEGEVPVEPTPNTTTDSEEEIPQEP